MLDLHICACLSVYSGIFISYELIIIYVPRQYSNISQELFNKILK